MVGRALCLAAVTAATLALMAGVAGAATIKVTTIDNEMNSDGDCALREAVQAANTNAAVDDCTKGQGSKRDTIQLKVGNYTSGPTTNEDANADGDFDITGGGPLTILGKGRDDTSVFDGSNADRLFHLTGEDSDLTLDSLRVSSGDVTAGFGVGGDVLADDGKLTIRNSKVTGGDADLGGAVWAEGNARVTISKTLFDSNDANGGGGSIGLQDSSRTRVKRSTFQLSTVESSTQGVDGGIFYAAGEKLTITDSTLQGSSVHNTGAGIFAHGGAIWTNAETTIKRSLIQGNGVTASTDNVVEDGGAIYADAGSLDIVNSTLFNNSAGMGGDDDGRGGAIFVATATVNVSHTTLDANDGTESGDAFAGVDGTLAFRQSIIEDSPDPCDGTPIFSGGFNVTEDDDADCDFVNTDAPDAVTGLGSVSDNGGPTETIPISPSSKAKDFVPKAPCKVRTKFEDQRRFVRPKGKKCDAGAFELGAKPN